MESTIAVARRKALRPPGVLVAGGAAIAPAVARRCDRAGFARVTLMTFGPGESHPRRRADEATPPSDAVVICATGEEAREVALEAIQGPAARAARACPHTVMILATPLGLDLAPAAARMTGLPPSRVLATGGLPLAMRERRRLAVRHGVCASQCDVVVIGADAVPDLMLLPRYTRVAGIPVSGLGPPARRIAVNPGPPRLGVAHLVAAAVALAWAVVQDRRAVLCCGARSGESLGIPGGWVTSPVRVGRSGAGEVLPLGLSVEERAFLQAVARLDQEAPRFIPIPRGGA